MNKPIKTLIVDDEPGAREGLELMLSNDEEIEIYGVCKNGIEAIQTLRDSKVDLIFLDIHMPVINGFEVLDNLAKEEWPFVVFVTAFDEYAIKAFEYHALDYLLKPFSDNRFEQMLRRAKKAIHDKRMYDQSEKYEKLRNDIGGKAPEDYDLLYKDQVTGQESMVIKDSGKIYIIPIPKISCLEAFDYYIKIHYGSQFVLTRIPLKNIIGRLPPDRFIRVHRSHIINMEHIEWINKGGKGEIMIRLRSGKEVRVSDTYKKEFLVRVESM
jgi:two-component system LytT family response regulator